MEARARRWFKLYPTFLHILLFSNLFARDVKGNLLLEAFYKNTEIFPELGGSIKPTSSKIHCATMCNSDERCLSFSYNRSTKFCEMSDKLIFGGDRDTYIKCCDHSFERACHAHFNWGFSLCSEGKNDSIQSYNTSVGWGLTNECNCINVDTTCIASKCPRNNGYQFWSYPDMALCLKYSGTTVNNHQEAIAECSKDGGHLVLIVNDEMRKHIKDVLEKQGAPTNEYVFVDGFDVSGNDVFVSWKGGQLPWTGWSSIFSDVSDQDCMLIRLKEDCFLNDGFCDWERKHFLCQIDL